MPSPTAPAEFLGLVRRSGLIDESTLNRLAGTLPADPEGCAAALVEAGHLSEFQAKQLLKGRYRGFVLGPYTLVRPIGQGGMGAVYLAEHKMMRRQVAVKILPQDRAADRLALERFYREARAAAALDHPNIVRLHDIAQGGGVHFLVMEYVEGATLQATLDAGAPLDIGRAARYAMQVAAGLAHAHAKGFVHRDIKPANLIVAPSGQVKILDMGLARSVIDPKDQLTAAGAVEATGTADFLAPEQARNEPVDARADIYGLGATLFTLLTGKVPFEGTTAQKLLKHQLDDPPNIHRLRSAVSPELGEVVRTMMAKDPAERYQTAEDVIDALRPWLPADGGPASSIMTRRSGDTEQMKQTTTRRLGGKSGPKRKRAAAEPPRRKKWLVPAVVVGVLSLVGVVWAVSGKSKAPQAETAATEPTPAAPAATVPASARFRPLPLGDAATATTTLPLFYDRPSEVIVPPRWGEWTIAGVPFDLIDPQDGRQNNAILLNSTLGTQSAAAPGFAVVKVGERAAAVHLLGLVGGWCWPFRPARGDAMGEVTVIVRFLYSDGEVEEHHLRNGEHIADYIRRHDVPGSAFAFETNGGQQVRYLALRPRRDVDIREIQFIKGTPIEAAPVMFAVTVERPAQ